MLEEKVENPMAVEPVKHLMLKMGIPMIFSMALQAVYNIVDSAFVSHISGTGEMALNALTLAFPVQIFIVAIGIGTGVGTNVLVSKTLGQGDKEKAGKIAGNGIFLCFIIYILFALFGLTCVKAYVASQTADKIIREYAIQYLSICCIFSFGIVFFSIFEKLLQATGKSLYSTIAQVSGAIANMILDPILIYGLLGFPKMDVKGAALATVIGQVVSCLIGLLFHLKKNKEIFSAIKYLLPDIHIIKAIYSIGFPAIIAQALMSIMTYGINVIFNMLGTDFVTAYGLYYKIQQFILFCAFGLRDAIMPIVAFNYGSQNTERINDGIKYGMLYSLIIMLTGVLFLEIFATPFATMFGLSGHTQNLCISAMRIISISLIFAGVNIAYQGVYQALEDGLASLIISILRQFILVLPVAYILVKITLKNPELENIVFYTFIFAEAVSSIVATIIFRRMGFHLHKVFAKKII